jgi:hypothetical protein
MRHATTVQKDAMLVRQPMRVKNVILGIINVRMTNTSCVTIAHLVAKFVHQMTSAYNVTMGISNMMVHVQNVRRDARIAYR